MRKALFKLGRHGRTVRGFVDVAANLVRVQWTEQSKRKQESFPATAKGKAEARAFGEGTQDRLSRRAPEKVYELLTIRDIWNRYLQAESPAWRPATTRVNTARWRKFETFATHSRLAAQVTRETLDAFRAALTKHGHAINQVALHVQVVRMVFGFAADRELIPPTRVPSYRFKIGKDEARLEMAEYRADDAQQILAQFDPRSTYGWRPFVLTTLLAYLGARQTAARSIEWADVDFDAARLRWRKATDKMGRERYQPMPPAVIDALRVAYGWRCSSGYGGAFVLFGAQSKTREKPWTYQAYAKALHDAERAAGISPVRWRGAHAFRRGVAGDVHAMTGSEKSAADWIGDKSVKIVRKHYLLTREDELRAIGQRLEDRPKADSQTGTKQQRPADEGEPEVIAP